MDNFDIDIQPTLEEYIDELVNALTSAGMSSPSNIRIGDTDTREIMKELLLDMLQKPDYDQPTVQLHIALIPHDENGVDIPEEATVQTIRVPVAFMEKALGRVLTPEELADGPPKWIRPEDLPDGLG